MDHDFKMALCQMSLSIKEHFHNGTCLWPSFKKKETTGIFLYYLSGIFPLLSAGGGGKILSL